MPGKSSWCIDQMHHFSSCFHPNLAAGIWYHPITSVCLFVVCFSRHGTQHNMLTANIIFTYAVHVRKRLEKLHRKNWKILTSRQMKFNGQHSKATHALLQNNLQHMLWHGCNTSHTWSAAHYNSNTGYLQCVWILCNNYVHNRLCTKKQQMTGHRPAENIKFIQSISRIAPT